MSPTGAVIGGSLGLNGGYCDVPNSPDLNFGIGDFSIFASIVTTASGLQSIVDKRSFAGGRGY